MFLPVMFSLSLKKCYKDISKKKHIELEQERLSLFSQNQRSDHNIKYLHLNLYIFAPKYMQAP